VEGAGTFRLNFQVSGNFIPRVGREVPLQLVYTHTHTHTHTIPFSPHNDLEVLLLTPS
jgi:hypothetical protein